MVTEMRMEFSDDIPIPVVRAIYENVFPVMLHWAKAERVDWATDIVAMSVQRHANRKDWVLHVSTKDGERTHFMVRMETLN